MHVHFPEWMTLPDLPEGAEGSQGGEPPVGTTHLVGGQAEEEWLDREALEAVIVPWAGIPAELARQMAARPHLALYNLHVNAQAVAELALGLLLTAARGIAAGDRGMRKGNWKIPDEAGPQVKLKGLTACLLGYGAIGQSLDPMLRAVGLTTLKVRRRPQAGAEDQYSLDRAEEALKRSQVLVVSLPLSEATEGWVTQERLMMLQAPRLVVNLGRGPLFHEEGLYEFLKEGQGWAGLDVWWKYPSDRRGEHEPEWPSSFSFQDLPNLVMSPHRGGWTTAAEEERTEGVLAILHALARGEVMERVDPQFG